MPRFIDRDELAQVNLGPCECEDKSKHTTDTLWIRRRLSYPDQLYLGDAMAQGSNEAMWVLFNLRVAKWNLVDAKGKPIPLSRAVWQNLDEDFAKQIQSAIDDNRDEDAEATELPND